MANDNNTSNQLAIVDGFGAVPAAFKDSPVDASRFTAGIGVAWPTLTIKGKEWGIRAQGEHVTFESPDPRAGGALMPDQHIDVVILDAGTRISKVYYINAFVDGQRPPPDCWSADGITPDPAASKPQSTKCGGCPHDVFGSKINQATGGRGKACSDNKRVAIALAGDIDNAVGPIMFRLPPGSFQNYTSFIKMMASRGYAPFTFVTRLTFDKTPHPKVVFQALRVLSEQEAATVVKVQKNPIIGEMLNDKKLGSFLDPEVADEEAQPQKLAPMPAGGTFGQLAGKPAQAQPVQPVQPAAQVTPPGKPELTADQKRIADLEAKLAAAQAPEPEPEPEPEPQPEPKTAEQLRIEQLEAQLAAAQTPKRGPGRPRTKSVSPPAEPNGTVTGTAANTNGNGNGASQAVQAAQEPEEQPPTPVGNNIMSRLQGLMKTRQ